MKRLIYIVAISGMFSGCWKSDVKGNSSENIIYSGSSLNTNAQALSSNIKTINEKIVDSVQYNFRVVSMSEFTGINNNETEHSNEYVLILSIMDLKRKSVDDAFKRARMDKIELSKYMLNQICSDIELHQSHDTLIPNGVLYEGQTSDANSIRAYLFIEGYKKGRNTTVQFYDRIFGNGIVKRNLIQ